MDKKAAKKKAKKSAWSREHASSSAKLLEEQLLDAQDYGRAALEAERALECLPLMARAALTRGRALLHPALTKMVEEGELPSTGLLDEVWRTFILASQLEPHCEEAKEEIESLQKLLTNLPPPAMPVSALVGNPSAAAPLDVIIVGAGAAGVGCALMLTKTFGLDASQVLLIERGENVGETFRRWPAEMRFISPSFNQQGWTSSFDLNSIAHGTSPAFSLHTEHPSGDEYANYLNTLASSAKLNVRTRTEVISVEAQGAKGGPSLFSVGVRSKPTSEGHAARRQARATEQLAARYVVWAAGEFQYPRESSSAVVGAELCTHSSRVRSWADHARSGDDFVLIGGFESGADAAINLAKAGKRSILLASTATWNVQSPEPSTELAPYTAVRLREVTAAGFSPQPKLLAPLRVLRVERAVTGGFNVIAAWKADDRTPPPGLLRTPLAVCAEGRGAVDAGTPAGAEVSELRVHTAQPPVLCTGFEGSVASAARHLFSLADQADVAKGCLAGAPLLTVDDESTKVAGIFLVGPSVRHGEHSFCFVYKFRQRFGVVANAICTGLGRRDTRIAVETCRKMNMYLDDLKCCEATCGETC